MAIESVAAGNVVTIHYTLRNSTGDVLDSSGGGDPLAYLHGAKNIVPGLERQLDGKKVGDKLEAVVEPQEGYGEATGRTEKVPRSAFGETEDLSAGMQVFAQTPSGETFPLWVAAVDEEHVTVGPDHPLAGETLHFEVEITEIRAATDEEKEHGHPHGPGGHEH